MTLLPPSFPPSPPAPLLPRSINGVKYVILTYGTPTGSDCKRRYSFQIPNFYGSVKAGEIVAVVCNGGVKPGPNTCKPVKLTSAAPFCT